jgi:hypothetical protein
VPGISGEDLSAAAGKPRRIVTEERKNQTQNANALSFYCAPLIVALSYTIALFSAARFSVHPAIAQMHRDSVSYQIGAHLDGIYMYLTLPIRPIAPVLGSLHLPEGFELAAIPAYLFVVCCIPGAVFRWVRRAR